MGKSVQADTEQNLERAQLPLIKKQVLKITKYIKVGHVWINDENGSWTKKQNESNSVTQSWKQKGEQGPLVGREEDLAEQNVGSSNL